MIPAAEALGWAGQHARLVLDDGVGAAEGLAGDEAMLNSYRGDAGLVPKPPHGLTVRLYTYADHAALIGRFQHLDSEVNLSAAVRLGVEVSRRLTGGGAILMGADQLGVALLGPSPAGLRPREILRQLSSGIVNALGQLGIEACFAGKNDVEVAGRKVAGLGLYLDGTGSLLFHASVLAGLDIDLMLELLRIPPAKLAGRGAGAVAQRVTTVSNEAGGRWDGARLRPIVAESFAQALGVDLSPAPMSSQERSEAEKLARDRYRSPRWLEQRRPFADATVTGVARTPAGTVRVHLAVQGGEHKTVKSVMFSGDFNVAPSFLVRLESSLKWGRLERAALLAADPLGWDQAERAGFSKDALIEALQEAGGRARPNECATPSRSGACYLPEVTR